MRRRSEVTVDAPNRSRREFLRRAAALLPGFALVGRPLQDTLVTTDRTIILKRFAQGAEEDLFKLPMGDLVARMGRSFLERPYEANTLEAPGPERVVVNLREFDCVTLCETSLALARAIKIHASTVRGYAAELEKIRYRGGRCDGYGSRLHYFSEWIDDNVKKHVVRNMTAELGGVKDTRRIDFMSAHREAYPRLAGAQDFAAIVAMEKSLERRIRFAVSKERVALIEERIQSGDIIAITTNVPGLDVAHTGIALREEGVTRLLHAPNVGQQVQITAGSLSAYLHAHKNQSGIMVARPLDPSS